MVIVVEPGELPFTERYTRPLPLSQRNVTVASCPTGPNSAIEPRSSCRYTQSPVANGQSSHDPDGATAGGCGFCTGGLGCSTGRAGSGGGGEEQAEASRSEARMAVLVRMAEVMAKASGQR